MLKPYTFILFICLISSFIPANAQFLKMEDGLKRAFANVMEFKLDKAREIVDSVALAQPENRACAYLKGIITANRLLIHEDRDEFDTKREELESYIDEISEVSDNDPQKRKMLGEIHLSIAVLHAKYQNNIRAGLEFHSAYNLLKENYEKFPEHYPSYVPLGVLYAAIGSLPEGYQSIASVFGMKGSVEEGMKLIHKGYWRTISDKETKFYREYYGFVYAFTALSIQGRTDVSLSSLAINFEKGNNLIYLQSLIDIEKGQAKKALAYLLKRPKGDEYESYPFLDYHTGKVALAFSTDTARIFLSMFLKENENLQYIKSTYRYLSWCYMLDGDYKNLEYYRNLARTKGSLATAADRQAQKECDAQFNEVLIRGRIYFDGGRYADAIAYMRSKEKLSDSFNSNDKLEFHYRLGRNYQEFQKDQLAIIEFGKALAIEVEESSYAQGNSALQLAKTYEKLKNKKMAKKYFEKTLTLQGFPFYEGLHQQAKAGLDRL